MGANIEVVFNVAGVLVTVAGVVVLVAMRSRSLGATYVGSSPRRRSSPPTAVVYRAAQYHHGHTPSRAKGLYPSTA